MDEKKREYYRNYYREYRKIPENAEKVRKQVRAWQKKNSEYVSEKVKILNEEKEKLRKEMDEKIRSS